MELVRGNTVFKIYKHYYNAKKSDADLLREILKPVAIKDDIKSEHLRESVKQIYNSKKYFDCLQKYTKCLSYATFNGRQYSFALANRSATYFQMNYFENSIIDINLSLDANYPEDKKPKLMIRKAKCFRSMGNLKEMYETIVQCYFYLKAGHSITPTNMDAFMAELKALLGATQNTMQNQFYDKITLKNAQIPKKHSMFPDISASLNVKFSPRLGVDFIADRDITCGEVLFIEEAYAMGFSLEDNETEANIGIFYCDHCWCEAKNAVPCKVCVDVLYCSEKCRNDSWNECHKWECNLFRSRILLGPFVISLRTLIKAALSGVIYEITKKPFYPSNELDPYLFVHNWHLNLEKLRSENLDLLLTCCNRAFITVEYLKTTTFFKYLMNRSPEATNYNTLVNLIGGLLLQHNIQYFSESIMVNCSYPGVSIDENNGHVKIVCKKNLQFHAFCPKVSSALYSCNPNTTIYFDGKACIVMARQNIERGELITRSGFNISLKLPLLLRKKLLKDNNLKCFCSYCQGNYKNIDYINSNYCLFCDDYTILQESGLYMFCKHCINISRFVRIRFLRDLWKSVKISKNLSHAMRCLYAFQRNMFHPHHVLLNEVYKELIFIRSKGDDFKNFEKSIIAFRECAKGRAKFNVFDYILCLTKIFAAGFAFLHLNKSNLQKTEKEQLVTYFESIIQEAKELTEVEYPPLMRILSILKLYLLKYRVNEVDLKDA